MSLHRHHQFYVGVKVLHKIVKKTGDKSCIFTPASCRFTHLSKSIPHISRAVRDSGGGNG